MSKASGGGALSKEDTKQDYPLQAIVVCDPWSDQQRWGPLVRRPRTDDEEFEDSPTVGGEQRPWCLLPLLNIPLLGWTLESLATAGVEQVFLFAKDGADEIRQYLSTLTFQGPEVTLSIVVRPTKALTPGDVLREVDSLQILSPSDYLVVQAGYVGNVDLKHRVEEFAQRKKADPNLTMSCLVSPIQQKTNSVFAVHALSARNDQLLHYEQSQLFPKMRTFRLPREALGAAQDQRVTIRSDLESVGLVICSNEVAPLFTENFDYQNFYPDFVNGLLTSDLLGKTICCSIIEPGTQTGQGWAGVVGNTKSYDWISNSILSRKSYPLSPDENLPSTSTSPNRFERYEQRRSLQYYGTSLDLSRTCKILPKSLLGNHTAIGARSVVSNSVLGVQVQVGAECEISKSHVFSGCRLERGVVVRDSILGENVVVEEGVTVEQGSLVGAGCKLGKGAVVRGMRVSIEEYQGDREVHVGQNSLGQDGVGYFWPGEDRTADRNQGDSDDEDEDDEDFVDPRNLSVTRLGHALGNLHLNASVSSLSSNSRNGSTTSLSTLATARTDDSDLDEDSDDESTASASGLPTIAGLDVLEELSSTTTKHSEFKTECLHSLDRSFAENHTVDNAAIELKTLRMASNVDLGQVRAIAIPYLLKRCDGATNAIAMIDRWGGLIMNLTGDSEEAMIDCLLLAQTFVAENAEGDMRFWLRVLKGFYETDVVTDDAVFAWYKSVKARNTAGETGRLLWQGSRPFLEALQEDDDESDEEDEDSD
ncbi:translation initiation factor eIF2B catalytic subunit epsilon [Sporobolomyces koalae]|uniref:translation initiation factor eIF2B catalytic subunit epsilon n=1 Tax=Sporobolomyces koalae TaxID=500713 RepID=UPI0031763CD1